MSVTRLSAPARPSARSTRVSAEARGSRIRELQDRVSRMEGSAVTRTMPVVAPLEPLLQPRTGGAYAVDSLSLMMTLLAAPSQAGEWGAVIGIKDFGLEAAAGFGVDLARTIDIPEPGERWPDVVAGLAEIVSVIVIRADRVTEHQAARLRTRLRQRDAMVITLGDWPRCDARLSIESSWWAGLGQGHGRITGRQAVVSIRRAGRPSSRVSLWLPGPDLQTSRLPGPASETTPPSRFEGPERIVAEAG